MSNITKTLSERGSKSIEMNDTATLKRWGPYRSSLISKGNVANQPAVKSILI
ncbi:unnamed protein product [Acidithrix sp. C25]|nr:unnamed protein product [Acidithrix sp. C25]